MDGAARQLTADGRGDRMPEYGIFTVASLPCQTRSSRRLFFFFFTETKQVTRQRFQTYFPRDALIKIYNQIL
jgi:hypothetical protein